MNGDIRDELEMESLRITVRALRKVLAPFGEAAYRFDAWERKTGLKINDPMGVLGSGITRQDFIRARKMLVVTKEIATT